MQRYKKNNSFNKNIFYFNIINQSKLILAELTRIKASGKLILLSGVRMALGVEWFYFIHTIIIFINK